MMFQLDVAFATELIALVLGTGLLVLVDKWEIKSRFTKVVGVFVIAASLLGMLCTAYWAARYRLQGHFVHPYDMRMEREPPMMR
jgi:hypothetical protein